MLILIVDGDSKRFLDKLIHLKPLINCSKTLISLGNSFFSSLFLENKKSFLNDIMYILQLLEKSSVLANSTVTLQQKKP